MEKETLEKAKDGKCCGVPYVWETDGHGCNVFAYCPACGTQGEWVGCSVIN